MMQMLSPFQNCFWETGFLTCSQSNWCFLEFAVPWKLLPHQQEGIQFTFSGNTCVFHSIPWPTWHKGTAKPTYFWRHVFSLQLHLVFGVSVLSNSQSARSASGKHGAYRTEMLRSWLSGWETWYIFPILPKETNHFFFFFFVLLGKNRTAAMSFRNCVTRTSLFFWAMRHQEAFWK